MTVPVPPKGSVSSDEHRGASSVSSASSMKVTEKALEELAALAARLCGTPAARIFFGEGLNVRLAASWNPSDDQDPTEPFPYKVEVPVPDDSGRVIGSLSVLDRVPTRLSTEQRETLGQLGRQAAALFHLGETSRADIAGGEEAFRNLLDLIPDAVIVYAQGKIVFANPEAFKLMDVRSLEEIVGRPIASFYAPEFREAVESRMQEVEDSGLPTARRGIRFHRHDGAVIPLETASLPLVIAGKACRLVVFRNASEEIKAREDLREVEDRFQAFMDRIPLAAFMKDEESHCIYSNRMHTELFGIDPLFARPGDSVWPKEAIQSALETDAAVLASGKPLEMHQKRLTKDGELRTWWMCKFPMEGKQGRRLIGGIAMDVTEKERDEARIRIFADIFRNIQVGLYIWKLDDRNDPGGFRLVASNSAATTLTGIPMEDILGKTVREVFPVSVMNNGLAEKCRQALLSQTATDLGEFFYTDHRIAPSTFTAKVFPLPNDTVGIAFENISENRRTQEMLRQSVERFELIARATNDAVWEYKPAGGQTWWNARTYQLFGYDPSRTVPSLEAWIERLHPGDRDRVLDSFRKISSGGADTWVREYRIVGKDGTTGHIYERGYVVRGEGGAPVRMLAAMLDITELKLTEDALRENKTRLHLLLDQIPALLWSTDSELRFTSSTGAGLNTLGLKPEQLMGQPLSQLFPGGLLLEAARAAHTRALSGIPTTYHSKWIGRVYECHVEPLRDREGTLTGAIGFARDINEKRLSEEALKESEERYRKLVELSPDIIAISFEGRIDFINQAGLDAYGAQASSEIIGKPLLSFFHPDSHESVTNRLLQIESGLAIAPMELKFVRKNGDVFEAESRAMPIQWRGRRAALAVIRDITARKQAEAALRHSEERYRTLATISPVGLYRTDAMGRNTYVNEYLCGILGMSREELEKNTGVANMHPDDFEWVRDAWNKSVAENRPFKSEFRVRRPDGGTAWVMGNSQADRGPDGKITGFIGTITDITERKQAEILLACQQRTLALVASGRPLQEVLDGLVEYIEKESNGGVGSVLLIDSETKKLIWTSARGISEGIRRAPAIPIGPEGGALGLSVSTKDKSIRTDLEADGDCTGRKEALAAGLRACASWPILGSNGQVLGVFALFFPRAGEPAAFDLKLMETASGLAGIAMERARQEEIGRKNLELSEQNLRILEASRMKSEFMASMSHELRTPLNAIIGFSQLLIDRKVGQLNDKQSEYLGDILDGGMHLLRLINDVLDLAKIEAGKMQLFLEPIHVGQAIREVCDILMPMAMGRDVTLRIMTDPAVEVTQIDGQKFRQVLYNLVSNAIKFSRTGGEVRVLAAPDSFGGLRLTVIDHGIGIKKEDIGKLFQQFQQLDSGSARHYPGTGLGLVITKKLVELHQGSVGVESEYGKGSSFYATFPKPAGEP
jgi:PAS domain S-box-containing protein